MTTLVHEMRLRGKIEELPDGDYWAEDYVDSDGHSAETVRIRVRVTVRGSELEVDLTGSGAQCMGPINASSAAIERRSHTTTCVSACNSRGVNTRLLREARRRRPATKPSLINSRVP